MKHLTLQNASKHITRIRDLRTAKVFLFQLHHELPYVLRLYVRKVYLLKATKRWKNLLSLIMMHTAKKADLNSSSPLTGMLKTIVIRDNCLSIGDIAHLKNHLQLHFRNSARFTSCKVTTSCSRKWLFIAVTQAKFQANVVGFAAESIFLVWRGPLDAEKKLQCSDTDFPA